jgi:TRAP-type C4-dicarboxylate transport system substrate-binding protein
MKKQNGFWTGAAAALFAFLVVLYCNVAAAAEDKATSWIFQLYITAKDAPEATSAATFADEVDKKSNGRLKIKTYLGGTLGYSGFDLANVCAKGAVQMVVASGQATATIDPVFAAADQPFRFPKLSFDYDKIEPRLAMLEAKPIYDRHAAALGLENLGSIVFPNSLLAKKKVATVEDWKGLKLRTYGRVISDLGEALGASVHKVAFSELYSALATGVVEANVSSAQVGIENRLYEVCKYFNDWPLLVYSKFYFINKKSWDALPKDLQDIVTSAAATMFHTMWKEQFVDEPLSRKVLESKGMTMVEIAPAEVAKVGDICNEKLLPTWQKEMGPDGQQLFNIFAKYAK